MARHRVRHYPEARARPGWDCGADGGVSIKDFPTIKKKKRMKEKKDRRRGRRVPASVARAARTYSGSGSGGIGVGNTTSPDGAPSEGRRRVVGARVGE